MSRRLFPILLVAAVVFHPGSFAAASESPSRDFWSGESFDPAPDVTSQACPKAPAVAPVSVEAVPPSEELLHQRPFFKDWGPASTLGEGSRPIRAPPLA